LISQIVPSLSFVLVLISKAPLDSEEKEHGQQKKKNHMKDCFLGSVARDLMILSQPAALMVLLARKAKFLKKSKLRKVFKAQRKRGKPQRKTGK